jgi:hypothetical protein
MKSFQEFLSTSKVSDDNIEATLETVSFTNKNGKKFVYPTHDLERCLQALWIEAEKVERTMGGDWSYEEGKFRNAFSNAFEGQGANAVASNLGSQTPNTVRCLELYAYFMIGEAPTSRLQEPKIFQRENLDKLFYGRDMKELFQSWLRTEKALSDKSVESYTGAISGLLSKCAGKELFRVLSSKVFDALRVRILSHQDFLSHDKTGNQMYGAALNHYKAFLTAQSSRHRPLGVVISAVKIREDFAKALAGTGFKTGE